MMQRRFQFNECKYDSHIDTCIEWNTFIPMQIDRLPNSEHRSAGWRSKFKHIHIHMEMNPHWDWSWFWFQIESKTFAVLTLLILMQMLRKPSADLRDSDSSVNVFSVTVLIGTRGLLFSSIIFWLSSVARIWPFCAQCNITSLKLVEASKWIWQWKMAVWKFVAITFMSQIKYGFFPFLLWLFLIGPQKKTSHETEP